MQTDFFMAKETVVHYWSINKRVDFHAKEMTLLVVLDTVPYDSWVGIEMNSRAYDNEMVCKMVNETDYILLYHDSSYNHILNKLIPIKKW